MLISDIQEFPEVYKYLEKRGLLKQYSKSKKNILSGVNQGTNIKILHPKHLQKGTFRINKQFRAIFVRTGDTLKVYKIDNHQNY